MIAASIWLIVGFAAAMMLTLELGYRVGRWRRSSNPIQSPMSTAALEASVFGLMGLLIAFTFYGAATRFDARRILIVHEANAIGTAYLRLDLLPAEAQPKLRDSFR